MSRDDRPRLGRGLSSLIRNSTEPDPTSTTPASTSTATHSAQTTNPSLDKANDAYVPVATGEPVTHHHPQPAQPEKATDAVVLPISSIEPNPSQPRRTFNEKSLAELAHSIKTHGLLQPVIVSQMQTSDGQARYHLIAGERRWRAAKLAGVDELPCILRPASRQQMLELALIENIHRDDLNPIERARAYRDMMDQFNLTQQQVAERVGQARASVANFLRILDLCDEVQKLVLEGVLSLGHAKVLAGLAGKDQAQSALARKTVLDSLSVRQLEVLVKAAVEGAPAGAAQPHSVKLKPPYLADVERQLSTIIGTRVSIRPGRAKHTGKIEIEYYNLEDFDRILSIFGASIES